MCGWTRKKIEIRKIRKKKILTKKLLTTVPNRARGSRIQIPSTTPSNNQILYSDANLKSPFFVEITIFKIGIKIFEVKSTKRGTYWL